MDPKFPNFLLAELKELVADLENALQPSNGVLHEVVTSELRRQYDKQERLRYRLDGTQAWQG